MMIEVFLYNLLLIYGIYNLKYYPLNVILKLYTNDKAQLIFLSVS